MYFCTHMQQASGTENVGLLFKNLQRGLELCTAEELNEAITSLIIKKVNKGEEIEFILNEICAKYEITKRGLFSGKVHKIYEARKLACCLLHYELGLSHRNIAVVLKQKYHTKVGFAIRYYKTINKNVKTDREFQEKYRNIQVRLIESINQKEKNVAE